MVPAVKPHKPRRDKIKGRTDEGRQCNIPHCLPSSVLELYFSWQKHVRNISASNVAVNRANVWEDAPIVEHGTRWKKQWTFPRAQLNNAVKPCYAHQPSPRGPRFLLYYHRSNPWYSRASPWAIQKWTASLEGAWWLAHSHSSVANPALVNLPCSCKYRALSQKMKALCSMSQVKNRSSR